MFMCAGDTARACLMCFTLNVSFAVILWQCDFESAVNGNPCGVRQSTTDSFQWLRHSGQTNTANTGPAKANTGIYYFYTEMTGRRLGDTAV